MRRSYRGNAKVTTLAGDVQVNDVGLTLANGDNYPDGSTGPFVLTLDLGQAGEEKVLAASRSGTAVTGLTRGYDGTVAGRHSAGAPVAHTISAVDLDEANSHVNDSGDPHPQYLTQFEGSTLYTPISHVTATDPHAQYLTATRGDALFLTPAEGNAAYAPLSLVTATDPYPQYLTAAEGTTAINAAIATATSITDWVPLNPGAGWLQPSGSLGLSDLSIMKDHNKLVTVVGTLFNQFTYFAFPGAILTLPATYRPAAKYQGRLDVVPSGGTLDGQTGTAHVDIEPGGVIRLMRSSLPLSSGNQMPINSPHGFMLHWRAAA